MFHKHVVQHVVSTCIHVFHVVTCMAHVTVLAHNVVDQTRYQINH